MAVFVYFSFNFSSSSHHVPPLLLIEVGAHKGDPYRPSYDFKHFCLFPLTPCSFQQLLSSANTVLMYGMLTLITLARAGEVHDIAEDI